MLAVALIERELGLVIELEDGEEEVFLLGEKNREGHDLLAEAVLEVKEGPDNVNGPEGIHREDGNDSTVFPAYSSGERTRSFLKVQDGCDYKCAYCTVPYARGASRNIPIAEIISQANEIAATGIREIVLTGVNTGDFGKTTGESFLDLLKRLNEVDGIERYRISSIEPNLLTEEIVDWIASGTKFLPHFHIPLQSGSDTVLKAMGRRYDTSAFSRKISHIRERMEKDGKPRVFFGIDVIAGFPGETDADFAESLAFVESMQFANLHVFTYSPRGGTPAASLPGRISAA